MLFIKIGLSTTFSLLRDAVCRWFHLDCKKTCVWRVGYFTRGNEVPGDSQWQAFIQCCLWKSQYRTISKKENFQASGVSILPLEIEGSVPSGIPPAPAVRLGLGVRHLPDGIGACSLPCQMSLLLPQGLPQLPASGSCSVWCSWVLPLPSSEEFLDIWECAWLISVWFHFIHLMYFVYASVSFLLLGGFCTLG